MGFEKKHGFGYEKHVKTLCLVPVAFELSGIGFRQWALRKSMALVMKDMLKLFALCLLHLSFQVSAFGSGLWEKAWLELLKHVKTLCLVPVA
ncbi:hypothetical protein [Cellulophaga sp. BC115SP]|uniref:hypothetical protein n=1 Tax=Cellulophaga sp. BC115SP TaxID=2683263 RepID=UPI001412248E|nr:hypothetical protein [Cellulophaga sp. BC115SP]NBB27774.1 hypothetical protein [Cellulophaga sp. BC115SP]